jgi:rhamnose transport system permease protein
VDRIKLGLYAFSGFMAALAALIFVSRVSTAKADAGLGTELDVITAVVLGGTSIYGGQGSILGTVLGLVLVTLLRNGLALAGIKGDATVVIIGATLVLAVLVNGLIQQRRRFVPA